MANEDSILLPIVYIGTEDVPVLFTNQFVIQYEADEFILTMGQLTPPVLLGTDEERRAEAEKIAYVPVKVVGRYSLSRQKIGELINILQRQVEKFDAR